MNGFILSLVFGFMVAGILVGFVFALEQGRRGILRYFLTLIIGIGGFALMIQTVSFTARQITCGHIKYALENGTPARPEILQSELARQCGVDLTPLLERMEGQDVDAGDVRKPEESPADPD